MLVVKQDGKRKIGGTQVNGKIMQTSGANEMRHRKSAKDTRMVSGGGCDRTHRLPEVRK